MPSRSSPPPAIPMSTGSAADGETGSLSRSDRRPCQRVAAGGVHVVTRRRLGLRRAVSGPLPSPRHGAAPASGPREPGPTPPGPRPAHRAAECPVQYLQASFLAGHGRNRARSRSRCPTCPGGGSGGLCGCRLSGFLVRTRVMTAHRLPPAAIHRHTLVSWGPRAKTRAARVHTVIAALAITTQDSNRSTILTRPAPARRGTGAGPRTCASGRPRS